MTAFPGFRRRSAVAQAQRLELHRRARPRPDRHLCLEKDGLGFQVFNAVNDTITADHADRGVPGAVVPQHAGHARPLGEFEAPLSNRKIREVLGFREEHNWRKYL